MHIQNIQIKYTKHPKYKFKNTRIHKTKHKYTKMQKLHKYKIQKYKYTQYKKNTDIEKSQNPQFENLPKCRNPQIQKSTEIQY